MNERAWIVKFILPDSGDVMEMSYLTYLDAQAVFQVLDRDGWDIEMLRREEVVEHRSRSL